MITMTNKVQKLERHLFSYGGNVYAVLDGAAIPELLDQLYQSQPEFECLYRGELDPDIAAVAPYLVRLDASTPFVGWLLQHGWEKYWGIFAISEADIGTMRRHFRKFLTVHDHAGRPLLFRFYDPRVLSLYLLTCTNAESAVLFNAVKEYIVAGTNPNTAVHIGVTPIGVKLTESWYD